MTQEEKLEEAKRLYKDANADQRYVLERLFPELAESKDEKIRKELIEFLRASKNVTAKCYKENDRWVAWLEKQGEKDKLIKELGEYKVKYTQEVLEKHLNSMSNKDDERLRKTTISFLKDFADKGYENAVECIDWLEKQDEQKSITQQSVKPIFNVGDTIVEKDLDECGYGTIREIKDNRYIFTDGTALSIEEQNLWKLVKKETLKEQDSLNIYDNRIQYSSIRAGIEAHAEIYSFNIESVLFPQLTKEQQKIWRKEIEQAVISGGEAGVELARDPRYEGRSGGALG